MHERYGTWNSVYEDLMALPVATPRLRLADKGYVAMPSAKTCFFTASCR